MLEIFNVHNFKSLVNFEMRLSRFNVLIGMNGAGKSTILQAIDFMSQLMYGKMDDWLVSRNWTAADLPSKLLSGVPVSLSICLSETIAGQATDIYWDSDFQRKDLACSKESVVGQSLLTMTGSGRAYPLLEVAARHYRLWGVKKEVKNDVLAPHLASKEGREAIAFTYQGSILSQLVDGQLSPELRVLRDRLRNIRSLELLSPHLMRQKARGSAGDIGFGGEKLSSFVSGIKGEARTELVRLLQVFYPRLIDLKASSTRGGWKRLAIVEEFNGRQIETEARHINDGLLRILAILAQSQTDRSLLVFDEIENGVNPELVEKLVQTLLASRQQMIVTTHSPLILNYLDDATARESVQFVYKSAEGHTRIRRFFDLPRINQKLAFMGAGEAFVDTDLVALTEECLALDELERAQGQPTPPIGRPGFRHNGRNSPK
jgi:predicted ATPase